MVGVLYNAVYNDMGDMIAYKGLALIVIGGFGSLLGAALAAFSGVNRNDGDNLHLCRCREKLSRRFF